MDNKEVVKILSKIHQELKGMRADTKNGQTDACGPDEAISILGYPNNRSSRAYLFYFCRPDVGLLTRTGNRKAYIYSKAECLKLAEAIKAKKVYVPAIKYLYS